VCFTQVSLAHITIEAGVFHSSLFSSHNNCIWCVDSSLLPT